mmetsp:Transcript_41903/g.97736  ORF Transcript_41903/g.97736 Transcript_41903/m.97736 type:complete len:82 (+) Transcript_41903:154-399(+)
MWTRNNPTAVSSKEKAHMQILKFCPLHPNEKQEPELRMEKHELTLRIENTLLRLNRHQTAFRLNTANDAFIAKAEKRALLE